MEAATSAPVNLPMEGGHPSSSNARKPRKPRAPRNTFVNISAEQASGSKVSLSAHSIASEIYLEKLTLTEEQRTQIKAKYQDGQEIEDITFNPTDGTEQLAAAALLGTNHLDIDSRESLENRWSVKWGRSTGGKRNGQTRRVLYQW
jgi:hypothetical protein